jgi:hypothetical protein
MESITFNSAENKITVTYFAQTGTNTVTDEEGNTTEVPVFATELSTKDYFDRAAYLADWPDREADCDAMEWA